MVTPGKTVAAVPIHIFFSILIGPTVMYSRRLSGSFGCDQIDLVGNHHLVPNVDVPVPGEHALVTDEDLLTDGDIQPVVAIEGRDALSHPKRVATQRT
jgi:hypothetical protein